MQLYMSERDGTDKIEDNPIKACSCWFTHGSRSATSGANLYILLLCCFVSFSSFLVSLSHGPSFSRSSICMLHRQPYVDYLLDMSLFPSIMDGTWNVLLTNGMFFFFSTL